ncbi:MAG: hypothetical protein DSO01_05255 [Archaeoglobi archaeon]|nr:hypothetical protein [Archaeoglobales archaeon]TDA26545.1 MAG: hypothetical protein DSO01_05255 [Archaeoglobi archaeon]
MDVETRTSILMDAFEELKKKWEIDENALTAKEEKADVLPETKVNELLQLKEKYKLDDIEFLFLVGAAVGYYQGQMSVKNLVLKKLATVNQFVNSLLKK